MAEDIKITMLGATGAGKTCFMVGMYAIMRDGVRGFTFSTDPDLDLDLGNFWDQMVEGQGADRWPPPNDDQPKSYMFNFNYGLRKLQGFEWLDYRGGALNDRASVPDVQALMAHLHASSCVFLCVSGEHLATSVRDRITRVRTAAKISRMNTLLAQLREQTDTPPPVVIALTKYDQCQDRKREEVFKEIKELFNPLFAEDAGWLVTICPVSLGTDLAEDLGQGEIAPDNVHLPVTFAVYATLKGEVAQVRSSLEEAQDELQDLRRGWFRRWLNKADIHDTEGTIKYLHDHANEIEGSMNLLAKELLRGAVYFNGKEVRIDD